MKTITFLLNDANEILNGLAYKFTKLEEGELPLITSLEEFKDSIISLIRISEGEDYSVPILIHIENGVEINLDNEVCLTVNEKFRDLATYYSNYRWNQN